MVVVVAIIAIVVIVGALIYNFVLQWDAPRKRWCVMFYLTAQTPKNVLPINRPDAQTGVPAGANSE